jgi:hypothetical protein
VALGAMRTSQRTPARGPKPPSSAVLVLLAVLTVVSLVLVMWFSGAFGAPPRIVSMPAAPQTGIPAYLAAPAQGATSAAGSGAGGISASGADGSGGSVGSDGSSGGGTGALPPLPNVVNP